MKIIFRPTFLNSQNLLLNEQVIYTYVSTTFMTAHTTFPNVISFKRDSQTVFTF